MGGVYVVDGYVFVFGYGGNDFVLWVDQYGMVLCVVVVFMVFVLCGGEYIILVFDGVGMQQDFLVCGVCDVGEGCWYQN